MSHPPTPRFRIVALSVLLSLVLVAPGCDGAGATSGAGDGAWTRLPSDVTAVMHLDMAALARSDLYRQIDRRYGERLAEPDGEHADWMERTGFDPRTDLEGITVGVGGEDGAVYMIATGQFDREKIELYARDHADVTTGTHEDLTTYRLELREEQPDEPSLVAWLDERTLILASEPDFSKLARSARGRGDGAGASVLAPLLDDARGQAVFALALPERDGTAGSGPAGTDLQRIVASQLDGPLGTLRTLLLTMETGNGLELAVRSVADTESNGRLVHDMLSGYVAIGRLMSGDHPELGRLLERVRIEQVGPTVSLTLSMTAEDVISTLDAAGAAD